MTFVKVNPRRRNHNHINPFFNVFNEFMNSTLPEIADKDVHKSRPAVNVIEGKENFKIELAAPGLDKSDFNINIEKNVLTISAEKAVEENAEAPKYSRREFNYNEFSRTFRLPKTIDTNKVKANFNNGILILTLAKKEEAKEQPARKIEIS